jgi:hypothetical protein
MDLSRCRGAGASGIRHFVLGLIGGVTRYPSSPDWPLEVISIMTFAPHDGGTLFTLRLAPVNASIAECKAFDAVFQTMQQGWAESLKELGSCLANDWH